MEENQDWVESTLIATSDGASRIGMLIDLNVSTLDDTSKLEIEVRGFDSEGHPLPWVKVQVTYAEDYSLVARHDPSQLIYGAQMRLPKTLSTQVEHVTFAALVPEPPGQESGGAGDQGNHIGHKKSALSVSQLVQPRATWNAKATQCSSQDPSKSRMAIHHTHTPPSSAGGFAARVRGIQAYHMDVRGWCDIGYHYLVTKDGTIWEGRSSKYRGAHVGNHNTGNVGISFVGCFQSGACANMGDPIPSTSALDAGANLVDALVSTHGIVRDRTHIKGHLEHAGASTSCPGDNLLSQIDAMIAGEAPTPAPPAPAPAPAPAPNSATGKLAGVVWDISSGPSPSGNNVLLLPNASVTVLGVGTQGVLPSNAYWEFELAPGLYTVTASAPGYESQTELVIIEAGQTEWSSLGLQPVTQPQTPTVCYPGPNNTWDVCFELTHKSNLGMSGYSYPAGAPSSPQYKAPSYFLDLSGLSASTALAHNFAMDEFMQSWKGQYAVFSPSTVVHWQHIRDALGVPLYVNSGFRSPGYNAGIDGAATHSRHMFGDAADVSAQGAVSLSTIESQCVSEGADYVAIYTSHVHCDWRNDPLDPAFWASSAGQKPGAQHGHHNETNARAWVEVSNHEPSRGSAVYLQMRHHGFDEGIPWVRWTIHGPSEDRVVEATEALGFVVREPGTYRISWTVAGYLQGQETIIVR
jgi:hypothetical protein